jgi:hypothetical protein
MLRIATFCFQVGKPLRAGSAKEEREKCFWRNACLRW